MNIDQKTRKIKAVWMYCDVGQLERLENLKNL